MIFNSSAFVLFALVFFSVYVFLGKEWRRYFLLAASYFFYGWWDWRCLGLIFLTTAVDFYAGIMIERAATPLRRKMFLLLSVGLNLSVLFVFKYFNFFASSFDVMLNVILPVGISFYTFQSIAYTVDVYRRQIPAEKNILNFAVFVSFFPQLVAGPIERAGRLLPQIKALPSATAQQIREGIGLVIWGYFLKVFIADNMARIVNIYFDYGRDQSEAALIVADAPDRFFLNDPKFDAALTQMNLHLTSPEIAMCMAAFALQIYGDFAGYSNIARGLAKFFGIELMVNFRQPYLAANPSDFWRRWHISLSTWFRDYVYIPLGGSRHGVFITCRSLMFVMVLAGLWHGAAWNFVLWGAYWGVLLVLYHLIKRGLPIPLMFALTLFGWLIFRAQDLSQLGYFTNKLLTNVHWPPPAVAAIFHINLFWVIVFGLIVLAADLLQEKFKKDCLIKLERWWEYPVAGILIWLTVVYGGQSEQFIYFRF